MKQLGEADCEVRNTKIGPPVCNPCAAPPGNMAFEVVKMGTQHAQMG
jgi:hypothetical protein